MAVHFHDREPQDEVPTGHPLPEAEVRAALDQILESQPFRTSKQCKNLLRYIVEHSLAGDDAGLRERVIGVEAFGRQPAYNTDEDPVVRTRAADVRKRLAQYYLSAEPGGCLLRIQLQPGSYRARFRLDHLPSDRPAAALPPELHPPDQPAEAAPSPHPAAQPGAEKPLRLRRRGPLPAFLLLLVLASAGSLTWLARSQVKSWAHGWSWTSPQDRFWAPLTTAGRPVLVYLGSNAAYRFSARFLEAYRAAHGMSNTGPEFFVDLPPGSSVRAEDLVPVKNTFVTASDAAATVELTKLLTTLNKPFVVRSGSDLSMGELRNGPALLVGAFNNPWTVEITDGLPFRFREGVRIEDRDHPGRSWSVSLGAKTSTTDDYALITRVLVSKTGGPVITVAGISEYGTRAAAELLADPERMRELLSTAPAGWERGSMQVVLHVRVLGYQPVGVSVVAAAYW